MIRPSTFSIVAYAKDEDACGVAVASKFPAVGALVPWASAGVGAIATQSYANVAFGPDGLDLMSAGHSAQETIELLIKDDSEANLRQMGVVDTKGGAATFSGEGCYDWAGGLTGDGFAIQGNILVGSQVVEAMAEAYQKTEADLPGRLMAALMAGDRAGGDRRGRQSAAILVVKPQGGYGGYTDRWIDYRVDDHTDPVLKLSELLELHRLYFGASEESDRLPLQGETAVALQKIMAAHGYYDGEMHGQMDEATKKALDRFIGNENFEDRTDIESGVIDRPVFEYLVRRFGS
ncbi:MAG: DUF1028 domain-containing protein [Anaerolineales bacterium]|jgi:uncharacterized Ntn-hydrolase superfamily protein